MIPKLGRYAVFVGIALIAVGLLLGFGAIFFDPASPLAKTIGLVPVGFLVLLTGTVMALLGGR